MEPIGIKKNIISTVFYSDSYLFIMTKTHKEFFCILIGIWIPIFTPLIRCFQNNNMALANRLKIIVMFRETLGHSMGK